MRAKSEIISSLSSNLTDDVWKKLKNSLLGKELIAFGAEVISENENVKDTMLLQLNPDTANMSGLYMLSQMNEVPITHIKPSCIVVQMLDNVRTFAPYELTYSIGNVHFTNIEYSMQNQTISLLNGAYKNYTKGMYLKEGAVRYGEESYFYDGANSYFGIKLGNAYPDSIIVCDENELEIQRYSSDVALSETIGVMYKIVTGYDGSSYIRFICSEGYTPPARYRIEWLDHDCMDFDIDENNTYVKVDNEDVADIKYFSQGTIDDVDYMRMQLKKEMAKYNGLNTPASVERYVRSLPYVLDAKCERVNDNINVYIKPSSYLDLTTYLEFSEIAAHISLNSILFPKIKVRTANQIKFGIEISGVEDNKIKNGIKKLIQDKYSYNNMTFNTVVNTGSILNDIYEKYKIVPTINMTIRENYAQNKALSFKPMKNTLKFFDINGNNVAWEENNVMYGVKETSDNIPFYLFDVKGSMGTMFLLMLNPTNIDENGGYSFTGIENQYSRFYLYDVSNNTLKSFDGAMLNLLKTEKNPSLNYSAWSNDEQSFGNLYDVNFLSTNDSLTIQFIFKDNGTAIIDEEAEEESEEETLPTYKYWNKNNTTLYDSYANGDFDYYEKNEDYKGKFETYLFIENPQALKNFNYDGWQTSMGANDGNPNALEGLYSGIRNYRGSDLLNIKSNGFFYNHKYYYVSYINAATIIITNGVNSFELNISGDFLGMANDEDDLYVVQNKYITKISNFDGIKEKKTIYQIYKDNETPITLVQFIREFDGRIVFKTQDNKIYTSTGFVSLDENRISFANLYEIFEDIDLNDNMSIGGCTEDYVSICEKVEETVDDVEQKGYNFYCYDIKNKKTTSYKKAGSFELEIITPGGESSSATQIEYNLKSISVAEYYDPARVLDIYKRYYNSSDSTRARYIPIGTHVSECVALDSDGFGEYFYFDHQGTEIKILPSQYKDIRVYWDVHSNECTLIIPTTNQAGNESNEWFSFVYFRSYASGANPVSMGSLKGLEIVGTSTRWNDDDYGSHNWPGFRRVAGFYKLALLCYYDLKYPKKRLPDEPISNDGTTSIYRKDVIEYYDNDSPALFSYSDVGGEWEDRAPMVNYDKGNTTVYKHEFFKGSTLPSDTTYVTYTWYKTADEKIIKKRTEQESDGYFIKDNLSVKGYDKVYIRTKNGYTEIDTYGNGYIGELKVDIPLNKQFTVVTATVEQTSITWDNTGDSLKEIATIGFYDSNKNSCVNLEGNEISYVKYYTQNPSNLTDSYLVLDENAITFI